MKVIGVVTLVLSIAALLSYGPGVPTQNVNTGDNSQLAAFLPANSATAQLPTVQNTNANPPHGQPGHRCDIKVGAPLNSAPTIPAKLVVPAATVLPIIPADGLNPKHGQPGHRCDIAVGAPLNSKPAATVSSTSVNTTPVFNNLATPSTTAMGTPPSLNPKHGQPFHRCDIAVGAPLNSKPAATVPSTSINTTPVFNNNATPSTTALGTPPRLNPKHGQPFHRCDIMVGQPLNSKATIPPIEPKTAIAPAPVVAPLRSAANTAAPLLNPKHGQPGHRCDMLVGQPLNGKPAYTLPSK